MTDQFSYMTGSNGGVWCWVWACDMAGKIVEGAGGTGRGGQHATGRATAALFTIDYRAPARAPCAARSPGCCSPRCCSS